MTDTENAFQLSPHDHMFLGKDHDRAERRTWAVIILCGVMMIAEIIGGALFGSLALIADGLHMSTHAGALLLAALAYTYARKYANDRNFTFGTGKFGDLAGYSSAIVLAMIALLIGYEAVSRLFNPVPISFNEAIPIAVLGLAVNVASATASPICTFGGWGPVISAPSSRSQPRGNASRRTTARDWPDSPICPMSPSRCSIFTRQTAKPCRPG